MMASPQHHLLQKAFQLTPESRVLSDEVPTVTWFSSSLMRRNCYPLHPSMDSVLLTSSGWYSEDPFPFPLYKWDIWRKPDLPGSLLPWSHNAKKEEKEEKKNSWPGVHLLGLISLLRTQMRHFPFWPQESPSTKWGCLLGLSRWPTQHESQWGWLQWDLQQVISIFSWPFSLESHWLVTLPCRAWTPDRAREVICN